MTLERRMLSISSVTPLRGQPHLLIRSQHSLRTVAPTLPHPAAEVHMATWKTLVVIAFGVVCLALALATLVVPMTMLAGTERSLWLAGLLVATVVVGSLFALFLNIADSTYNER